MEQEKCCYAGCIKYGRAQNRYARYCEEHVRLVMGFYAKGLSKIILPNDYKFKEESWIQSAIDRTPYPKRQEGPRRPKRVERR